MSNTHTTTFLAVASAALFTFSFFCGCEKAEDSADWQVALANGNSSTEQQSAASQPTAEQTTSQQATTQKKSTEQKTEAKNTTDTSKKTQNTIANDSNIKKRSLPTSGDSGSISPASSGGGAADAVPFSSLKWTYANWSGAGAKKTSASIGGLRCSGWNLSYRWTGPTLSSWGLADNTANAVACVFVNKNGTWVGGKIDWISTSRTSRSLKQCVEYRNWNLNGVPNPCSIAFVIVSQDGKKRTNVIAGTWSR